MLGDAVLDADRIAIPERLTVNGNVEYRGKWPGPLPDSLQAGEKILVSAPWSVVHPVPEHLRGKLVVRKLLMEAGKVSFSEELWKAPRWVEEPIFPDAAEPARPRIRDRHLPHPVRSIPVR